LSVEWSACEYTSSVVLLFIYDRASAMAQCSHYILLSLMSAIISVCVL